MLNNIPWEKFLISAAVGFIGLSLLSKPRLLFQANQSQFFGFSGPQIGLSQDVQTPNCTPSNMTGNGLATYCNPPGVECAQGVDCADARAQYCRRYAIGGVCLDNGIVAPNQGLPGQGPVIGSANLDLTQAFGYNPYTQQYGSASPYGYGYNPYPVPQYPTYGYGYGSYGYGSYQPPQPSYGSYGYGYGSYGYNSNNPYYRYQVRRGYQGSVIYDKKTGHFLYGAQAVVTPIAGGAAKLTPPPSYDQSIITPCLTGDC